MAPSMAPSTAARRPTCSCSPWTPSCTSSEASPPMAGRFFRRPDHPLLNFLCRSYAARERCPSNSYERGAFYGPHRQEASMLDLVFLGGGVLLFCLLIAYERLCNRL